MFSILKCNEYLRRRALAHLNIGVDGTFNVISSSPTDSLSYELPKQLLLQQRCLKYFSQMRIWLIMSVVMFICAAFVAMFTLKGQCFRNLLWPMNTICINELLVRDESEQFRKAGIVCLKWPKWAVNGLYFRFSYNKTMYQILCGCSISIKLTYGIPIYWM